MNVNEVMANRCARISGEPLSSQEPVYNIDDHVNMSQSSNEFVPDRDKCGGSLWREVPANAGSARPARRPRRQGMCVIVFNDGLHVVDANLDVRKFASVAAKERNPGRVGQGKARKMWANRWFSACELRKLCEEWNS
jgi:hypothetical protein